MSTPSPLVGRGDCDRHAAITRSLLGYGVLAGPFYVVVGLVQALMRDGFDLTRHDLSLLANGPLGWIQIANLVLTGAMVIAAAVGMHRALGVVPPRAGVGVGPKLLGVYGAGLVGAGLFVADPMQGFPRGTPDGPPVVTTIGGIGHLVCGGIGFLGLVAACVVLGRRFAREGRGPWAWFSWTTGVVFLAAFVGIASGSASPVVILAFWVAVLLSWAWLAAVSVDLYRRTPLITPTS